MASTIDIRAARLPISLQLLPSIDGEAAALILPSKLANLAARLPVSLSTLTCISYRGKVRNVYDIALRALGKKTYICSLMAELKMPFNLFLRASGLDGTLGAEA